MSTTYSANPPSDHRSRKPSLPPSRPPPSYVIFASRHQGSTSARHTIPWISWTAPLANHSAAAWLSAHDQLRRRAGLAPRHSQRTGRAVGGLAVYPVARRVEQVAPGVAAEADVPGVAPREPGVGREVPDVRPEFVGAVDQLREQDGVVHGLPDGLLQVPVVGVLQPEVERDVVGLVVVGHGRSGRVNTRRESVGP